jgi:hypothetical protein
MAPIYNKNLVSENQMSFPYSEEKQEEDFHHFQVNGELGVVSIREHKLVAILEERLEARREAIRDEDAYFKYEAEKERREEEDYLKEQQKIEEAKEKLQKEREEEWLRKESEQRELEIAEYKLQKQEYERAEELKDKILCEEYKRELEEEQMRMDAELEAQFIAYGLL